ncbi:uncharacterized protein LOC114794535 [Denticeps clupeoides]|uniref:uncharacterized protein LOC114794535 n=1 Tax=Denticeps clupeoides TaxID=299321 RepID=UPI0010A45E05|nr:uncharacterized protein LOC114794535 [Denticeps clupeoides]
MGCKVEFVASVLVLLVALIIGAGMLFGGTGGSSEQTLPWTQGTFDWLGCAGLILRTTAWGAAVGLVYGVTAVAAVWAAELLSTSEGLVSTVVRIPLLGLLIGGGAGAAEGAALVAEVAWPFGKALKSGMNGAAAGGRVAIFAGVAVGGAICTLAAVAVRNMARGQGLRTAPLITVSVVFGALRMVLSFAPGCLAAGAFAGSFLGTVKNSQDVLVVMATVLGSLAGARWLGGAPPRLDEEELLTVKYIAGGLSGAVSALCGLSCAGLHYQVSLILAGVLAGAAMAYFFWATGEVICHSLADVVEKLLGAVSFSTHYSHGGSGKPLL